METEVVEHESYKETYHQCIEWVTAQKHKLHKLNDTAGPKQQVQQRLHQVQVRVMHYTDITGYML